MRNAHRLSAPRGSSRLLLCALLAAGLQPSELEAQRRNRDSWQRVPDVIAALAIGAGSRVADVGAGSGYFTAYLAREVGASGRVFAVDISERSLSQLRRLAEDEAFENIEVVRGAIDDPRLPAGSLDAVLVVDAYHEMTESEAMLAGMFKALKPGGRLVMIDFIPADPSQSRARQTARHELSIDIVEEELRELGFEVLDRDDRFTQGGHSRGQWLLVARR
ncbi:MAG: class I SAM-dependent methyltransferase [Gemmatimonadales bacterium]|jgi:predicted methyltransferase